ncbi:MAG: hypothetical protein AMXMBFR64_45270 [Myxococcales bacterium]
MERLVGKKIWVIQYDDEDDSVIGICEGFSNNFIALRQEQETEPSLYIHLANVKEIEVFRTEGEGEVRFLRAVKDDEGLS